MRQIGKGGRVSVIEMIYPRLWFKHARARRALVEYPLYDAPHKQAERKLSEPEVQENFAFFHRVRLERLAFFQAWLLKNFAVKATLDGDGLTAVSRWIDDYGGGLISDIWNCLGIFESYRPLWSDAYAGYNVMFDIGIFLGEYLLAKRPRLHWDIYRGHALEPATYGSAAYLRPHLGGMPRGGACDVLTPGCNLIASSRQRSAVGHDRTFDEKNALVRIAKGKLYYSRLPEAGPIVYGDSKNEPI